MTCYGTVLPDGTALVIRPVESGDKDLLQEAYRRLSPETRYRRFFSAADHLTDKQLAYLTEVDFENHVAWLAVQRDQPGQPVCAVARWIRLPAEPDKAESAITVGDAFQRQGLGSTLMWLLALSAIERGVRFFVLMVLADNQPMINILNRLYARPGPLQAAEKRWVYELPAEAGVLDMFPPPLPLFPLPEESAVL